LLDDELEEAEKKSTFSIPSGMNDFFARLSIVYPFP
jgi:hypothetical protein